jgi:hypothetical protein
LTERDIEIGKEILHSLRVASPTLLAEPVLHAHVSTRLTNAGKAAATRDEFEGTLRLLDAAGTVTSERNRISQALRWTITDQGRVALREM